MNNRISELLQLAEAEGFTLPMPAEMIVALEDTGAVVDLRSGAIRIGEADTPYRWEFTEQGRHLAAALAKVVGG